MTKQEIKEKIEACEKELAELRQKMDEPKYGGKRWKPRAYETYYYVCADGNCGTDTASPYQFSTLGKAFRLTREAFGNMFRTKEEAEFAAERLRVIAELSDFAEGDEAVWDTETKHYYLLYRNCEVLTNFVTNVKLGVLYFPSHEAARAAIKAVGANRIAKYYLRVNEVNADDA